ncbi:hypothetical protein PsAD26_02009 [Pseudovibrio sp. Ad26]|nr:hypothetical protein PsAD26_02009 [Pseudovibrio sp. Ad26]KZL26038.1 hypothetical protein PsWM33_01769 [Pseudovibrio sp. WM33]
MSFTRGCALRGPLHANVAWVFWQAACRKPVIAMGLHDGTGMSFEKIALLCQQISHNKKGWDKPIYAQAGGALGAAMRTVVSANAMLVGSETTSIGRGDPPNSV